MLAGLVCLGAGVSPGCTRQRNTGETTMDPRRAVRIMVNKDGVISLNGRTVTIDELKNGLLVAGRTSGSVVWYYRENSTGKPAPNSMLVFNAILESKLPVRLSTKSDFSDVAEPGGGSQ